ncbi:MAG: dephospho-CoA kinase, partial [bacterium]|nr:dephospho-CoA kinase [bacterium]
VIELMETCPCLIIVEAPVLIEAGLQRSFDEVWMVDCSLDVQINRIVERGMSREEAIARIGAQMSPDEKRSYAHRVIDNSGEIAGTAEQVSAIWQLLCGGKNLGQI